MNRAAVPVAALLAPLAWMAPSVAAGCPLAASDGTMLRGEGIELAFLTEPAPAVAHRPLAVQLRLCPADAKLTAVDATMPEHRHGMNYRPTLTALGDGRWQAQGLLLHMAGRWELRFDIEHGGRRQSLRHDLRLP